LCEKFRPTVEIFPGIAATNLKQGGNKLSKRIRKRIVKICVMSMLVREQHSAQFCRQATAVDCYEVSVDSESSFDLHDT